MSKIISTIELRKLLESDEVYALIDVREKNEYEQGQIFGATQIGVNFLEFRIPILVPVKDTKMILYDNDNLRSNLAANILEEYGYTNIYILNGGLNRWKEDKLPVVEGVHVLSKSFGEILGKLHNSIVAINPKELKANLEIYPDDYIIIDVRPNEEVKKTGSVPGAINIPGVELPLIINDFVKTGKKIIVTCAGRTRGFIAFATLRMMGLRNIFDLNNGTLGWQLAGYELDKNIPEGPVPSVQSRKEADDFAFRISIEQDIQFISAEELKTLRQKSDIKTLYILDVRSRKEYAYIGHIHGSISIPGGQAIQNSDDIIAVHESNIVFVCDNGTRSIITASWYKKMGFRNVYVLKGGLSSWINQNNIIESGITKQIPIGYRECVKKVKKIDAIELKRLLDNNSNILLIDVSDIKSFSHGHIPGSHYIYRGQLEKKIKEIIEDEKALIVISSDDGYKNALAASELMNHKYFNICILNGGNEAWIKAGYDIDKGIDRSKCNNWHIPLTEYGLKEASKYFQWEESLAYLNQYMEYFKRKRII